jgi:glucose/arabinose dehydrogenase
MRNFVFSFLILALSATPALPAADSAAPGLRAVPFLTGLTHPVALADDGSGRLFIVEQAGRIRLVENGNLAAQPFLDIRDHVKEEGECGLLCVVFHPQFAKNGRFFVNYDTEKNRLLETVVAEFKVDPHGTRTEAASEKEILRFSQPFGNHKGGQLV